MSESIFEKHSDDTVKVKTESFVLLNINDLIIDRRRLVEQLEEIDMKIEKARQVGVEPKEL